MRAANSAEKTLDLAVLPQVRMALCSGIGAS